MPPDIKVQEDSIVTADLVDETLDNKWNGRDKLADYSRTLNKIDNPDELIVEFDEIEEKRPYG